MVFPCLCASPAKSSIKIDYQGAEAMSEVIQAIHDRADKETVEKRLDRALKLDAYQICSQRYNNPNRSKKNRVTLTEYKKFILSFLGDSIDTQGNQRLGFMKDLYADAVKNPGKYSEALKIIKSIPHSHVQETLDIALHWLPEGIEINANVLILFDMGGGGWAHQTKDGKDIAAFNILLLLDKNGKFDQNIFLGTLAHEFHHIGLPLENYYNTINYKELVDTSPLKLYSDFIKPMISEGLAQKFCSNSPGKLSQKPYPGEKFAAIERANKNWQYFMSEFNDIHKRAIGDLRKILNGEISNPGESNSAYRNYWTWHAGKKEGKDFVLGRRYYYGSELLGVINKGLGREAIFEVIYDFRKLPPLYNKGLMKINIYSLKIL
jgi:hypothetical protein